MTEQRTWWKEAVAYQIYPKSFYDSDGDGIGDLRGILAKLDYLQTLGVDLLWLSPIYQSPDDDNGYDISDYRAIDPKYGTMADVERLLDEAHRRGMRVIMDLVINHTSDEHPWFVQSASSRDNPFRDYYIWRDGRDGREPNNWSSHFTKSAWTWHEATQQYYLHLFSRKQPDLNWDNPEVRDEIQEMIRWWLDKGIDGFRLDAIGFISKPADLPDNSGAGDYVFNLEHVNYGPNFHDYMREINRKTFSNYDVVTVGECAELSIEEAVKISAPAREELDMPFLFEHLDYYNLVERDPQALKAIITRWQVGLHEKGWIGLNFNNHDQPRVVSLFGNDAEYRTESATLFATLLLTLYGTPFLYQGEEIGMTSVYYDSIDHYDDVATINRYREQVADGVDPQEAFDEARRESRDRGRSPFQWNGDAHAGFTSGTPWLRVNPNYHEINLERNLANDDSVFYYYQKMIALRKRTPALVYGEFVPRGAPDELFVYQRVYAGETYQIVLNLSEQEVDYAVEGRLLIGNYTDSDTETFRPYEARVYRRKGSMDDRR